MHYSTCPTVHHTLNHLNQVHAHSSSLFKICFNFVVPCTTGFPNYIFHTATVYVILVLCFLLSILFHSPAFYFANGTMM